VTETANGTETVYILLKMDVMFKPAPRGIQRLLSSERVARRTHDGLVMA